MHPVLWVVVCHLLCREGGVNRALDADPVHGEAHEVLLHPKPDTLTETAAPGPHDVVPRRYGAVGVQVLREVDVRGAVSGQVRAAVLGGFVVGGT
eukprot:CAMPEP_0175312864 /NCGR_PEP_ID=MMETSP0093-20121207/67581_1 /TAXON_ID=311494 /ORGANISM="Alexandrium monilatum, Strain CCMP3105" /LENGTH=94 /DNA_ID=CAMNT_0016609539 /DNA_START=180 /DNA_END=464 /DNA_ORIENTATION=+